MNLKQITKAALIMCAVALALCGAAFADDYGDKLYSSVWAGNTVYSNVRISNGSTVAAVVYDKDGKFKEAAFRDDIIDYAYLTSATVWLKNAPSPTDTVRAFLFDRRTGAPIGSTYASPLSVNAPTTRQKMAAAKRDSYFETMAFSCDGLINQLTYDGFNYEEAAYAAYAYEYQWHVQAAVAVYLYDTFNNLTTRQQYINQLLFDGFTMEQAEFGYDWYMENEKN